MSKCIWFIGTAKAAVVVLIMMLVGYLSTTTDEVDRFLDGCTPGDSDCTPFTLTLIDDVGAPELMIPKFTFNYTACANSTVRQSDLHCAVTKSVYVDFGMVIKAIGTGLISVPIVCLLEHISLAKAFARQESYTIDATQEFVALGAVNVANSFMGAFPVSSAMSRSAVNHQANCATQLSGVLGKRFKMSKFSKCQKCQNVKMFKMSQKSKMSKTCGV